MDVLIPETEEANVPRLARTVSPEPCIIVDITMSVSAYTW
jgi:hypothetical protein